MNIQKIKDARKKGVVAFTRYCEEKNKFPDNLFCFFEGEDIKYYSLRIEKYSGYSFDKIIKYTCGGKKGVLTARRLITNNCVEDTVKKAFFIDSDYDRIKYNDVDLYQTPCYSVENFYTSSVVFGKILCREFGMNTTESDYIKCINDYKKRQQEFHVETTFINAWLACQRFQEESDDEHRVVLSNFKISRLFEEISIEKVCISDHIDQNKMVEIFPNALVVETDELNKELEYFQKDNFGEKFRGKFELEFLKKIIVSLRQKNKDNCYFSQKYECVRIDPNVNPLSSLADYADTPDNLVSFLERYKTA